MSHDLKRTECQENRLKFPDPLSLVEGRGLGTRLGILCVSNHVTHAYAHAHFSNKRITRELRIVCRAQGAGFVTREFERDNCDILQSDWTIPNRAGVPTKVPRPQGGGGGVGQDHVCTIFADSAL